jgi:acyl-CoA synthetase (AMP-forming)/AMP-acid ligase II
MMNLLVGDVLACQAQRLPNAVAASLEGDLVTYAELERRTQDLTDALLSAGVRRGDRVVWQAETSLEPLPLFFATARIGAVFVPINPRYTSEEAAKIIAHADPTLVLGDAASGHNTIAQLLKRRRTDYGAPPVPQEDDVHVIFYTSGTTGEPKGCMLSQRTQRLRAGNGSPWPRGGELCMFPQFHMSGWTRVLEHWVEGNEIAYVRRPDAEELMDAISRRRLRTAYCIPAVWQRVIDADRGGYDMSTLRQADSGTSAVTASLLDGIARVFPQATTTLCYGSTEGGLVCLSSPEEARRKPTAVGRPTPGTFIRLSDGGEMLVNGHCMFSGYFRNPEATDKAVVDGWYHTGDLAECDEDGLYSIIGRASDLIRTGGEAVAPVEVEAVLKTYGGISEVAIAGVPDPVWGEVVTAFVVPVNGYKVELEALRQHCEGQLASHKRPRRLIIVDSLPRTGATGQVQRRLLLKSLERPPA